MRSSALRLLSISLFSALAAGFLDLGIASGQTLSIDVTSATVQGSYLLNGAPYPTQTGEFAYFDLGSDSGDDLRLGDNKDETYGPLVVVAGDYTPIFEGVSGSWGETPVIGPTPLGAPVSITSITNLDIDVPAIDVTFEFTLNGWFFPGPPGAGQPDEEGDFYLRHDATGHEIYLGSSQAGPLSARILAGTYDVVYRHWVGTTEVPANENAVVADDVVLLTDQTYAVDVQTVEVPFSFLLNGSAWPTSVDPPAGTGRVHLRNFETGDSVDYGLTRDGPASRIVIAGTYDATWTQYGGSYLVPVNDSAVVAEDLDIQTAAPRVLDVEAVTITPLPLLDGVAFPMSEDDDARILLVDARGNEVVVVPDTDRTPIDAFIIEGTYDAWYEVRSSTGVAPVNPSARIATSISLTTDQTLPLDVPTADVALSYALDGGPIPTEPYQQRCHFTLVGEGNGNSIDLGSNADPPLGSLRIVAGSYDVVYDWWGGHLLPVNTDHRVVEDAALAGTSLLRVDVLSESVTPDFTLDAVPFPTDPLGLGPEYGRFYLAQPGGGRLHLGSSSQIDPDSVLVIEGIYDVEYEWRSGTSVPVNSRQKVGVTTVPEPETMRSLATGAVLLWLLARPRTSRPRR